MSMVFAAADEAFATTAMSPINGLSFTTVQHHGYAYHFYINFSGTGATSGYRVQTLATGGIGTGGTNSQMIKYQTVNNAGTAGSNSWLEGHFIGYGTANGPPGVGFMGPTNTLIATGTNLNVTIEGMIKAGSAGSAGPWMSNRGTGGQIILKKGSWGWYYDMGVVS
jgi:hypothetical protein